MFHATSGRRPAAQAQDVVDAETGRVESHLSCISTVWTMVAKAKGGPGQRASAAQGALMQRYRPAVYRYLLGALRDPDAADELAQEFALRFLRGDCRQADPARGRFRDFVKGVLSHMIADYYRRRRSLPQVLPGDSRMPVLLCQGPEERDRQFLESWRDELLARTWQALARIQEEKGQPFHAVLRLRIKHPDWRSAQLAEQLSVQLGEPVTATWVRQMLHRGREKFAHLLVAEVADTLENPTPEELDEELSDLVLLRYCQTALKHSQPRNL